MLIYVTAPDQTVAEGIGRSLVEEGLAACANVLPGMRSVYRWQGAVESADEAVLLVKTTPAAVQRAMERIASLHPYQTPCAVALPISAGLPGYLAWLAGSVTA